MNPQSLHLDRRSLFRAAAVGSVAVIAGPTLTACNPAVVPAIAGVGHGWLQTLAHNIAATAIVATAAGALSGIWESWQDGREGIAAHQQQLGREVSGACYGDAVPPALLMASTIPGDQNYLTERLVVLMDGDSRVLEMDSWAWQGLMAYIEELTKNRSGRDLAAYRSLCKISLLPSGSLDGFNTGKNEILTYPTRNGVVEMNRSTNPEGGSTVNISTTGIVDENGKEITREYQIETVA